MGVHRVGGVVAERRRAVLLGTLLVTALLGMGLADLGPTADAGEEAAPPSWVVDGRAAVLSTVGEPGVLAGPGAFGFDGRWSTLDALALVSLAAVVLSAAAVALVRRDPVDVVPAVAGVVLVLVWTLGVAGWVGLSLSALSVAVPALLAGVSVDFALLLTRRYRAAAGAGVGPRRAMRTALASLDRTLALAAVLMAVGLLGTLPSPAGPVRGFGLLVVAGSVAALVVFGLSVPALTVAVDERLAKRGRLPDRQEGPPAGDRALVRLAALVTRRPWTVLAGVVLVGAAGAVAATGLEVAPAGATPLAPGPTGTVTAAVRGAALAGVASLLVLAAVHRLLAGSAAPGAFGALPVLSSASVTVGSAGLLGLPLDTVTVAAVGVAVGAGGGYAVHVSERFGVEREALDVTRAVRQTLTGVGGALVGGAATAAVGLGLLAPLVLPPLGGFGLVTAATVLAALGASLLALPSALVLWAGEPASGRSAADTTETEASTAEASDAGGPTAGMSEREPSTADATGTGHSHADAAAGDRSRGPPAGPDPSPGAAAGAETAPSPDRSEPAARSADRSEPTARRRIRGEPTPGDTVEVAVRVEAPPERLVLSETVSGASVVDAAASPAPAVLNEDRRSVRAGWTDAPDRVTMAYRLRVPGDAAGEAITLTGVLKLADGLRFVEGPDRLAVTRPGATTPAAGRERPERRSRSSRARTD